MESPAFRGESRVFPVTVQYRIDDSSLNLPALCGAPVIGGAGSVVAMHLGSECCVYGCSWSGTGWRKAGKTWRPTSVRCSLAAV
jgi:hypothetical protein